MSNQPIMELFLYQTEWGQRLYEKDQHRRRLDLVR